MEDDENVYNLSGFQVVDEWSESEEDDDLSTKNDSFRNDETKKPSEGEIDAFLENVKSNVTTQDFKKKPKRNSEKQASLISKHNRPSLDHRREKNHREPRHDRAMLEERRVLRRSRSRENTRKKIHPSLPRKKIRSTSPRKKNPTPPRKHNLSASRRDYVGDSSSSFRPEMGLVDQFRDKMNMFGMQPFPNYDDNRQNFKQLPPPSTHHNYHPEYYPYVPGVDVAQPNPNFTNMGPYPINNAGHGMYKNFQSYGNSMEQPMMPGYDPYSQNQPYNPVQGYPGHMANPQPNTCYPTQQGVPGYLPCNSISMNTYQDSNTLSTTPAHAINPDYRLGEQYSLSNMDLHKKVVQTSKSKHHYNMPSPHGKEGKAARWNRSRSRSNDSSTSDERKSKRHSRSPAYPSLKTKRKYSISPPKSSKTSKIVIDPTRIPTPPPPPILSNYNNRDKRNIENNKITVEAKGKTQEAQVSKIVGTSNVSLSCLLEAVMESSGQGKSKVSNPSVKKEILYQCENKIRLMYKKRLSGLGAFIPEPVEEVMVNNNSSPLIVHHRYLLYNQGLEKDIWNCPGIIKPHVKKINSPKFLADSSEQPALIETLDSSKHRVKPKVSTTYSQFNKNVQVVESNITVSTMPYEQFNKNVQVVRSNETVSNISHEQLLPSTYPVLQHNSPAWLGSYNQPTWQEIPAAHQHNYLLSYPLHPSQAKSQNFPEEIRNLTYPINATNLLCPFDNNMYNTKKSTQSNITSVMGIESLEHSYQSNTVKGKMPDERKSKSPSLRRRRRSRIPLFPRRKSKSPLSPRRKSKSTLSRRRWSKSPLSPRRRSKSPLSSRRTRSPLSLSENEEDNFSPPVIDFAHFCHLVGPEIRKLQVMSLFYEGIIVALEKGDQSCGRSYKLQDGALCKKFTKLRIIIPHDYLIDCILILHQNFHTSTQKEICEFIKYYMYPAVHHIRKNVGRAFSECPQCKETRRSTKCALINEGNAEKTNESKQTMKVIKLEKEIDSMIGEQILTDSVNMNNNDKTCQNEIEEAEDSSLGRYPHEYGKETKIESEISEHDNECWNNDKLNVSKDNTLLSATIELSSSTSKDEVKIIDDRSQKCIILKGENSEVEVVEKSSKAQEMLAPNKPKGGSDFKARVRAVQLKCKESKERLVALEAGESSETYLLKGGMLCEKVRTADTVDIKIVAPLSEVDSIIGIVHTMSKTHTPESKLITFFLKHFTYIPEFNEKVKKFVSACSICRT